MMAEFFVDLQDANGTCYGTTDPWTDETIYFEDLNDARMYAKDQLGGEFILARVIDVNSNRVVDFFKG